jgi:hypothetical protein
LGAEIAQKKEIKMKEFLVTISKASFVQIEVIAKDKKEAENKAWNEIDKADVDWPDPELAIQSIEEE